MTTANRTDSDALQYHVVTAPLDEADLPDAEHILRVAFGSYLGAPEPATFWSDRDYVRSRWRAPHVAALGAKHEGRLVGSGFVTRWGSFAFCGPLTIDVDRQEHDVGKALLAARMALLDAWGVRSAGLFTFAHSPKHLALYQKFGFHARFLTAIMSLPVGMATAVAANGSRYGALNEPDKANALHACRSVTETLYAGLDLSDEINAVNHQGLGDTVLLHDADAMAAFAVCHFGPRSEAGADTCFVKFAAVRDAPSARQNYRRLLDACEELARQVGMPNLLIGVNLAHQEAYEELVARGYRTVIQGVAMHRHNDPGYCRPGVYILNDWR